MEQPLYTFLADLGDISFTLWTALTVTLAALAGLAALLHRRPERMSRNMQMLGAMLVFFVFLIAASTTFFSAWTRFKLGPVRLYHDAIETPFGRVLFDDIRTASIREEGERSFINPDLTTRRQLVLIIEDRNGKSYPIYERHYPIQEIMGKLKELMSTPQ